MFSKSQREEIIGLLWTIVALLAVDQSDVLFWAAVVMAAISHSAAIFYAWKERGQ